MQRMKKLVPALLFAAACGSQDNIVLGGVAPGPSTPLVLFDTINSSISGTVKLTDPTGNVTGTAGAIIISDKPGLCGVLAQNPNYFRKPPEAYLALIMFTPTGYLGTFILGRGGVDQGAGSEIVATTGPQTAVTPFVAINNGYIALTNWSDTTSGFASGSFDLAYTQQTLTGAYEFSGRFKTTVCPALIGVLLP